MAKNIFVVCEQRDNKIQNVSLELLGVAVHGALRVEYYLRYAFAVAQVDENYAAVVAHGLYPAY